MSKNKLLSPAIRLLGLLSTQYSERERYFLGRVLTIVDASLSDPEQRKGLKDLIKQINYGEQDWFFYRIRQILGQFCSKYAKFPLPDNEKLYLETGEWPKIKVGIVPVGENFFPE